MQLQVLLAHRPNGTLALKEALEVGPNVGRTVSIAVDRERAVLCLAQPQAPDLLSPLLLNLRPPDSRTDVLFPCGPTTPPVGAMFSAFGNESGLQIQELHGFALKPFLVRGAVMLGLNAVDE